MKAKLLQLLNRLELLSMRERLLALVGLPVALLLVSELLIFDPARSQAAAARKQMELQQTELKALTAALAGLPALVPLPGADQLLKQRNELQGQIEAARKIVAGADHTMDWGTVVRAAASGTPGLALTQLRTQPAELVFSPATAKPSSPTPGKPATPPNAASAIVAAARGLTTLPDAPVAGLSIYRHRAELTVKGDLGALSGYLRTLQQVPGDLRWDKLQISMTGYPVGTMQLALYTLSGHAETPFN